MNEHHTAHLATLLKQTSESDRATLIMRLKKLAPDAPHDAVNEAVDHHLLRDKIVERLGAWAAEAKFTRQSLEQSTHPDIAKHHAQAFASCDHLLEIGSGLGSDTAALARICNKVTSIESDPSLVTAATHNLKLQGINNVELIAGLVEQNLPTGNFSGFFADPSRRDSTGRRVRSVEEYSPKLSFLFDLELGKIRGIKISPAAQIEELPSGWVREFIGFGSECLEQLLWYGADKTDRLVTLVDQKTFWAPQGKLQCEVASAVCGYLVEPHPALIRTGALEEFYAEHHLQLLSPGLAYGISEAMPCSSPFYTTFEILESHKFSIKRLGARLKELGWNSRTEFKKRGFSKRPEEIRSLLKLPKPTAAQQEFGTVILTHYADEEVFIMTKRR